MLNIWLPLISNINNQGLSDYEFSSNNLAFTDTGKIGNNSAIFGGSNSYVYTDGVSINNQWSVGCWAKVSSVSSRILFQLGGGATAATSQFYFLLNSTSQVTYVCNQTSKSKTGLSLSGWHHYFLTYDGSTVTLYIDGTAVDTNAVSTTYSATRLTIGAYYNFSSCFPGSINDFRLYDTSLSAKEVNEISKGLVIHYTLSTPGNSNLLKDSMKDYGTQISGYLLSSYQLSSSLITNSKYTISARITTSTEKKSVAFYFAGGSIAISSWLPIDGTNYYTCTFTATNTMASNTSGDGHGFINVYVSNNAGMQGNTTVTGNASIEWIKLESGSTATPWCPYTGDNEYSIMGYDNKILYDTSGFKKNGVLNGNPGWTSDTPRYDGAYNFSGTGMYAYTTNIIPTGFTNTWTISIWAKYKDNTIAFGYSNGNRLSLYESNGCFYLGYNTNFVPFVGSTTHGLLDESNNRLVDESGNTLTNLDTPSGTSYLNAWHNYVVTGNGTTNVLYIDGTRIGSTGTYVSLTGTSLIISGNDNVNASYRMTNPISDFRLYSTVLTASQISDLYSVAASLASNGTLLSSGMNE